MSRTRKKKAKPASPKSSGTVPVSPDDDSGFFEDESELPEEEDDEDLEDDDSEDDSEDESEDESRVYDPRETVGAFRTVWNFVSPHLRRHRAGIAWLSLGVAIETGYNVAFPLSLKYLIDDALWEEDFDALVWILTVLGVLAVVVSAVGIWRELYNARLAATVMGDIRRGLFEHLQKLPLGFFGRTKVGAIVSRFSNDLGEVEEAVLYGVAWGMMPLLELLTAVALLFWLNWRLALASMLIFPLTMLGPRIFSPRAVEATYRKKKLEAETLSLVQENVVSQTVVRAFGLRGVSRGWFRASNRPLIQSSANVAFLSEMVERSVHTAVLLLHIGILGFGAWLTFHQRISIGTLIAFESVFWDLSYNIGWFSQFIPTMIHSAGSIQHIEDLLGEAPRGGDAPHAEPLPRPTRDIMFEDVSFAYEGNRSVLRNVSLTIPVGASIGVVGASGSGKSTFLNLLLNLYDPTSGTIRIDGHDLREVERDSIRSHIGVVFQESILFNTSIRENIRLGKPDATDAEVIAAARAAEIHDFIVKLPQGYETTVGERGGRLSGGQRQRIAIARAIIRDPAILVLDEATSALDPRTEAAILSTVKKLAKGRTVVTVTHRLNTVTDADRILVFDKGKLVEQGSHELLKERGGVYRRLRAGMKQAARSVAGGK